MRQLYLRDAQAGDLIEDVYVLTNKQFAAASNGSQYLKGLIGDRTTTITARMWKCTRETFTALPNEGFVRLRGRVENYQNNLQIIVEQFWHAKPETFDVADLIPHTTKDIPQMFGKLTQILGKIRSKHLKAVVDAYLLDEKLMHDFRRAPAAMNFHHAFLGGLLEHTLNAIEVAVAVCPFYRGLNADLVITGIFLHDIAKTWELTYETAFGYSDGGQLIGHIVKAAIWVEEKRKQAEAHIGEPIPQSLIDVLQHIILSHHGEMEFGSPKTPATPEALAVHAIENMDAKLTMSLGACRGEGVNSIDSNWTEYMKAFSGKMYRPDVAPADLPDPDAPAAVGLITNPLFEAISKRK
jgi:3'-5' exoribonuclease